jgi:hypothetical protein
MSETLVLIGWIIAADNLKNVSPPIRGARASKKRAPQKIFILFRGSPQTKHDYLSPELITIYQRLDTVLRIRQDGQSSQRRLGVRQ